MEAYTLRNNILFLPWMNDDLNLPLNNIMAANLNLTSINTKRHRDIN